MTAVSSPTSATIALRELDDLGVLIGSGEDDDHAVDHRLCRLIRIGHAVAVGIDGLGLNGAGAADVEDPLVLQDRLDRSLILEAGDDLEPRRRRLVRVGGRVCRLLEDVHLAGEQDVDVIAGLDEEVEAGDAIHLECDRLLTRLELRGDVDVDGARR